MIDFPKRNNELVLHYVPENGREDWLVMLYIIHPSGMIIMGRDKDWTQDQRTDFEVIRRKYRHVLEIMTCDDLLRRLKAIRDQFQSLSP